MADKPNRKSWAATTVLVLSAPFAFLAALFILVPLFLFVGTWNASVRGIYWVRWKISGKPIPHNMYVPPSTQPTDWA
jgi:hypothetical protein